MHSSKSKFGSRSRSPVFVVGCHRSGTNLLYDTLLSAGGFAIYRGYLPIHKMLIPRFGPLDNLSNRKRLIATWMRSKGFRKAGLDEAELNSKLLAGATNGGNFIRIVMNEICGAQNVSRWALYDPDNALYIGRIKAEIPDALFIHIVRDGRDIALSLRKMGEFRPFPWKRKAASLEATALYWRWVVQTGRKQGAVFPRDYIEIHFEDLAGNARETLNILSGFLDQEMDYDCVQVASLGRLKESNSSFEKGERQDPVNRWKEKLTAQQVMDIETLVGDCLVESGYSLVSNSEGKAGARTQLQKLFYPSFLSFKRWMKTQTLAGRVSNLSALELANGRDDKSES